MTRVRRSFVAAGALLALAACAGNPAGPSVPASSEFELAAGESAAVSGTGLTVRFERVVSDSRCPGDAICITAGEAEVAVSVRRTGRIADDFSLRTSPQHNRALIGDWALSLTALDPYPFASRPTALEDYRATFRVDAYAAARP